MLRGTRHCVGMTDAQAAALQQSVEASLDSRAGRTLDLGVPEHFATLVHAAGSVVTGVTDEILRLEISGDRQRSPFLRGRGALCLSQQKRRRQRNEHGRLEASS